MTASEDVRVDGEVEGTIELPDHALLIGPSGQIRSGVRVRSTTLWGKLEGKVRSAERVEIRESGSLTGNMVPSRILIEDGAKFQGSIELLQGPDHFWRGSPVRSATPTLQKRHRLSLALKSLGGPAGRQSITWV